MSGSTRKRIVYVFIKRPKIGTIHLLINTVNFTSTVQLRQLVLGAGSQFGDDLLSLLPQLGQLLVSSTGFW